MSILSDNIQKRRWELEISQEELARRVGYKGRASINKIECGDCDVPYGKLEKFAEALEIPLVDLMGLNSNNHTETPDMSDKLIILAGLPGSGRSYMMNKMVEAHPNFIMVKRYTTRKKWISEDENADSVEGSTKDDIKKCNVRGLGFNVEYGCKSSEIDDIFSQNKTPIIMGGVALVPPLRKIYLNSLSIFLMGEPLLQETAMSRQGYSLDVIHERFEHQNRIIFDALTLSLYDYILPNHYNDSSVEILNEIITKGISGVDIKGAISLKS